MGCTSVQASSLVVSPVVVLAAFLPRQFRKGTSLQRSFHEGKKKSLEDSFPGPQKQMPFPSQTTRHYKLAAAVAAAFLVSPLDDRFGPAGDVLDDREGAWDTQTRVRLLQGSKSGSISSIPNIARTLTLEKPKSPSCERRWKLGGLRTSLLGSRNITMRVKQRLYCSL